MAYPIIPSRRIPYDIQGAEIAYNPTSIQDSELASSLLPTTWLSAAGLNAANGSGFSNVVNLSYIRYRPIWLFFTELTEVTHFLVKFQTDPNAPGTIDVQGSADSTNGVDGTWEQGVYSTMNYTQAAVEKLRSNVGPISFSGPIKVLKLVLRASSNFAGIHVYGFKYSTETPDDILFVDAETGNNFANLMDWGDRPEGTTQYKEFKMKNSSLDKIANNVNIQLNHNDFVMSFSPSGPWTSVLDIASLGAGASSATIYLKNELAPPPLALGPEVNARIIATVGSWT